ncbi:MAG: UTP--glucose-1-phosphate uridylyltransferase [Melioribacteraceae bacterium]|nr:UTP--glucose-1-phosphate uridylyltransferase [Melioribacteraceae bacterium]
MNNIELFIKKMEAENLPRIVIETFEFYYNQLLNGKRGLLPEKEINAVETLPEYEALTENHEEIGKSVLNKSVLIKLNGGLGTGMGLSEAKSLLKIKENYTFIDIIAKQVESSKIPLVLMNSFNTQEKSLELLNNYPSIKSDLPLDFLQHKIPKISVNDFTPSEYEENKTLEWCPPGHGEIYTSLVTSGMLDKLLEKGIKYAFISNSDNLGAVMDNKILGFFAENNLPFLMEVAGRTSADKKGGHLAKLPNGQLILREAAQCPKEDENEFQNINKHKYFNTNNIWINLKQLKEVMEEKENILGLPMIVNKKNVNSKDANSEEVYQLETAMGSAISVFKNAGALAVPRARFAPVKTTDDLLAVRSDNYILTNDFRIVLNPERNLKPLVISLDKKFYKLVDDLDNRIPIVPSLVNCESLTIKGDHKLSGNIKFEGVVELLNKSDEVKVVTN